MLEKGYSIMVFNGGYLNFCNNNLCELGSLLSIVSGCWLDDLAFDVQSLVEAKGFFL
jgi:hypothetical protein